MPDAATVAEAAEAATQPFNPIPAYFPKMVHDFWKLASRLDILPADPTVSLSEWQYQMW